MTDSLSHKYIDKIPIKNKIARLIWNIVWIFLFRPTPRWALNSWRISLLRLFGSEIGKGCRVLPSCFVWAPWNLKMGDYSVLADGVQCYTMNKINIGDHVSISQRAFLCTGSHDTASLTLPLITKPILIGDYSWICAESFIGPGCDIGTGSVVAARAVVTSSVTEWCIVVGNPARLIKSRIIKE